MRKIPAIPILIFLSLLCVTTVVVFYGRGYRIYNLNTLKPSLSSTGLLVATSKPDGAQVIINGNLTTATNNTLNLTPGAYDVQIIKDGYYKWGKRLKVDKEVVTKADALLFPTAPRLMNITSGGIDHPVLDPAGNKLAFRISSQSARKNGIYVLDMNSNSTLTLQSNIKQLTDDTIDTFSVSDYSWSPDSQELIVSIHENELLTRYYLLKTNSFNITPRNITAIRNITLDQWEKDKADKNTAKINGIKEPLKKAIKENFNIISWSPDDKKIFYSASASANLPLFIKPRRIGIDTGNETRELNKDELYIYDIQDDINYHLKYTTDNAPYIHWHPDSAHLIIVKDNKISIIEEDNTNPTIVYAGPFINNYVFPWPDGSKIVILTNIGNTQVLPNLYTIGLE